MRVEIPAALATEDLTVRFGGVTALDGVTLQVAPTGLTGLIGPNGAGKSTFIDAVTGFLGSHVTGRVVLQGRDITHEPAHRRARLGLGRTWQSLELFDDITVAENLEIAARPLTVGSAIRSLLRRPGIDPRVEEVIDQLELGAVAGRVPAELTQRERKLVGVARAIVARPSLALLDEPAAGLDRNETAWLAERLRAVVDAGLPVLLIDHDMNLILQHCEDILVLDQGRLLARGTAEEIRADEQVIRAYLGSTGGRSS